MRFKPPNCNRLQGAADARRRARRRTFVLQVPDNKADAVPCERLLRFGGLKFHMGLIHPAAYTSLKWIEYMIHPMYLQGSFENYAPRS
jgi:hypothetical protein